METNDGQVPGNSHRISMEAMVPPVEGLQSEADKLRDTQLVNEVFSQDMLLEMILNHAIHVKNNSNLSRLTIRAIRLVNKKWMGTVSKLLQKRREPLFKLVLTKKNSTIWSSYVRENGKVLDQFVNSTAMSFIVDPGRVPTFHVKITAQFFRRENLQSLSKFLQHCGPGLLELELFIPLNGGSLPCLFPPHLSFPLLEKLTVNLRNEKLRNLAIGENIFNDSTLVTYLIQTFLNGAENLREFALPPTSLNLIPSNFQHMLLPASLTKLEVACQITKEDLELIANNSLPNLETLELIIPAVPSDGGYLCMILDSLRSSLKSLRLSSISSHVSSRPVTYLCLPIMEKLECFHLFSMNCELDPLMGLSSLEMSLPNVASVCLRNQTEDMFRKWTENSQFSNVTLVSLELVDENINYSEGNNRVQSIKLENMRRLHRTFPNVQALELNLSAEHICGLKYMLMEMTGLTVLKIVFACGIQQFQNSDFFDALFTGTTPEFIAGLRASQDLWEIVDVKNENMPSLKMLKDLTSLTLEAPPTSRTTPLNSDLLFHLALLKMPKLVDLTLKGMFSVSVRVREIWQSQNKNALLIIPPA